MYHILYIITVAIVLCFFRVQHLLYKEGPSKKGHIWKTILASLLVFTASMTVLLLYHYIFLTLPTCNILDGIEIFVSFILFIWGLIGLSKIIIQANREIN